MFCSSPIFAEQLQLLIPMKFVLVQKSTSLPGDGICYVCKEDLSMLQRHWQYLLARTEWSAIPVQPQHQHCCLLSSSSVTIRRPTPFVASSPELEA